MITTEEQQPSAEHADALYAEATGVEPVEEALETVECPGCHQLIRPTRPGGTRPRDHNKPDNKPCSGSRDDFALPRCKYCQQPAHEPAEGCDSPVFHPKAWTWRNPETGIVHRVGNAAAAGEIVHVSGQQYQWLARRPPKGSKRRAPEHLGYTRDRVRFYDLDAVVEFVPGRPGPGGRGPRAD